MRSGNISKAYGFVQTWCLDLATLVNNLAALSTRYSQTYVCSGVEPTGRP